MTRVRKPRLKPLLDTVPPGFLVDTRCLRAQGIDPKSIHDYVSRGWLERLIRGVYRRPVPEGVQRRSDVSWETVLLSLQRIMKHDVYLGGESALELAGFGHYLSLGGLAHVHFFGSVPAWLNRLQTQTKIVTHRRSLFGDDIAGIGDSNRDASELRNAVNVWRWPTRTSSPERAVLEMIDGIPNRVGFDHMDRIFESLTTLRPKQLMYMLTQCQSVKVCRLFFVFADRHRHQWREYLDTSMVNFGSGPRALASGGKIHPSYNIYVPKKFA